jgi:type I restriction enzyme M protein
MPRTPDAVIKGLWNRLWAGGIANPLTAIEQISFLIFLKRLDDRDKEEGKLFEQYPKLRWAALKAAGDEERLRVLSTDLVAFFGEIAHGEPLADAFRGAAFVIPKASLVGDAMDAIEELRLEDHPPDFQGDVYEKLLKALSLSGRNGQFRTPRHLINAIVTLVDPQPGETVCDPAAGTAGFLVDVASHVQKSGGKRPDGNQLLGYDFDASMVRLGMMNLVLHGVTHPHLIYQDTLSVSFSPPNVDVVLANPPFTGSIDRSDVNPDLELDTGKTELLFVELARRMLRPEGRAAVIVPEGVLFGASQPHKILRRRLIEQSNVQAIVSLPPGVFLPYTNVKTAIIYFSASGPTEHVWFCPVASDGLTLDGRRQDAPESDELAVAPEAVRAAIEERTPSPAAKALREKMRVVSAKEIVERDWMLAASGYLPDGAGAKAEEDPVMLIDELIDLQRDLEIELTSARGLMKP